MIRLALVSMLFCTGLFAAPPEGAAAAGAKKGTAAKETAKAADPLPAGAQEIRPGVWRHVDKDGKAWLLRRTPFGYSRQPEAANNEAEAQKRAPAFNVVAVDGDKVTFESFTPFGTRRWSKAKADLNESETAALAVHEKKSEK